VAGGASGSRRSRTLKHDTRRPVCFAAFLAALVPSIFTSSTSLVFLIPGCLLLLGMAGVLLNGYRRTGQRALLGAGVGFVGVAGLALAVQSFFVLIPGFVVAFFLYLRALSEPEALPAGPATVEVVYRVWAPKAHVRYRGAGGQAGEAFVQGSWEHRFSAAPSTPLGVTAAGPVGAPLVAELWCDGGLLDARHAPPEAPTAVLSALAQPQAAQAMAKR